MRHRRNSSALIKGIEALGLEMHVKREYRLPSLNSVRIPEKVSDGNVRKTLLDQFNVEIGGGLGALAGKIWRIGLMGINSDEKCVILLLEALERALLKEGWLGRLGEGVSAAINYYGSL